MNIPNDEKDALINIKRIKHIAGIIFICSDMINNGVILCKSCLTRRTPYGRLVHVYSFPKGHTNINETKLQCAIRECYEETGYNCIELLLSDIEVKTFSNKNYRYYIIEITKEQVDLILRCEPVDKHEVIQTMFIPFEKLMKMDRFEYNLGILYFIKIMLNNNNLNRKKLQQLKTVSKDDIIEQCSTIIKNEKYNSEDSDSEYESAVEELSDNQVR